MGQKITYVNPFQDEEAHAEYERALDRAMEELGDTHPLWMNGRPVGGHGEFEVRSPIDREILIGRFARGTAAQAVEALRSVAGGFQEWSGTDWMERARIVNRAAELLEGERFLLAALVTLEAGKTRAEALAEVGEAVDMLRYYCESYRRESGLERPLTPLSEGERCTSIMQPCGPFAVISPFNFPLALAAGMAGAALLTGNTVLLKPASTTPLSAHRLCRAFTAAGVPGDALALFTGPGEDFGEAIVSSELIGGIAFTGSRDAGMWLHRRLAERQPYPKPLILEMGSKNPCIVTASASLDAAAEGVARGAFGFSGQKCSATSRLYLQQEIADEFLRILAERTDALVVGDPRERATFTGPLIGSGARRVFERAIAEARASGGRILAGGRMLEEGVDCRGEYALPTIATGVPREHRLFRQELFVPFLLAERFVTLEEAVREANRTEFGLTAGIFSNDAEELDYFFRHIAFGVCYANRRGGATTGAWPGAQSFGGWKGSGSTGRGAGGPYYLYSFVREQSRTLA